jgi:hypothetical protein
LCVNASVTINTGTGPTAADITPTDAACNQNNGSITINGVTGGSAPYEYSVDGGGYSGTINYPNLAAGNHTVDVRDANGCVFSTTVTITSGTGPTAADITPTDAACNQNNGSISINGVTGGSAPYEYSVDGGGYSGTTNYPNLAAGNHTVDVRDANGCVFSTTVTITSGTGPTAADITPTDAACNQNNGSITINGVTGGAAPYEYSVDGGGYSGTTNYPGLPAGNHTVDVRDANGCVFSTTVTITSGTGPTAADITPTDAACNQNNGSITINGVTGGAAPYEYSIDGGGYSGTTNYPGLPAGNHTVDVRDANGCVFSTTVTITSGTGPTAADITPTDAACNQNNGSITINGVTGGSAPYQYSVDGGGYSGTTNYPGLPAGNHTVDVRDANGCVFSTTVTITSGTGPTAIDATPTPAACNQDNGAIRINDVTGGAAPYEYSVDGGGYSGTTNYPGLPAGNHTVDVRDANGCVFSTTVTITSGTGPTAIDATPTPAACNQDNGAIRINDVTGGAAPYEYSVDGGGYSGTTNYPGLPAGNHTVDVRDANGCVFSTTVTITSGTGPTAIDATPTPAACNQDNGAIRINDVTGGAAPYEYSIDGGGYSGTTNYPGLPAGNHTVDVRDANGCVFSTTVTITSGTGPTAIDATPTPAACNQDNGAIRINDVTGGAAPYEYSVDGGGYSGTTNYPGLSAGNHTVDVRDANGCVFSTTIVITSGTGPTAADITPTDAACNQDNGAIRINDVTGGAAPYEYSIDGGGYSGTTNYTALSAGNHTVDVSDANGCVFSTT